MKNIDFYFDLSSPYSYLAATQIEALAQRNDARVSWKPFVLGAVFKATNNVMPASSPPKLKYMVGDLSRWAEEYGVPMRMSSHFPLNTIKAMRLVLVADAEGKGAQAALAGFQAMWAEDRDISTTEELLRMAAAAGLDAARALAQIESPEVKDRLRANTDEAVRRGAFGAPAIFVGDELFWGNDRLHHAERALRRA